MASMIWLRDSATGGASNSQRPPLTAWSEGRDQHLAWEGAPWPRRIPRFGNSNESRREAARPTSFRQHPPTPWAAPIPGQGERRAWRHPNPALIRTIPNSSGIAPRYGRVKRPQPRGALRLVMAVRDDPEPPPSAPFRCRARAVLALLCGWRLPLQSVSPRIDGYNGCG